MALIPYVAAAAVLGWLIARLIYNEYTFNQVSKKYGCARPRRYPHLDPFFGLDLSLRLMRGIQKNESFALDQRLFGVHGKNYIARSWNRAVLHTMDCENVQAILSTNFECFAVEPVRGDAIKPVMGNGIFSTDGQRWRYSRNLATPIFGRAFVSDLTSLEEHVTKALKWIPRTGSTVDLQLLFKRLFLDVSTEFIFGQSCNILSDGIKGIGPSSRLIEAFETALRGIGMSLFFGRFRFLLCQEKVFDAASKEVHKIVDGFIDDAFAAHQRSSSENRKSKTYNLLGELGEVVRNRSELKFQLLNVFLPAYDSTAIGLSNIFFHLVRHPRVWDKLYHEAIAVEEPITAERVKSMTYMEYVINEGLRLHAPQARLLRKCIKNCVLPRGGGDDGRSPIFFQAGMEVELNYYALQRDCDVWGTDADKFKPERWEDSYLTAKWKYLAFSGGPRICPAQQMVTLQCGYILTRFLREFPRIVNKDEQLAFVEDLRVTMQSRNGVQVAFLEN